MAKHHLSCIKVAVNIPSISMPSLSRIRQRKGRRLQIVDGSGRSRDLAHQSRSRMNVRGTEGPLLSKKAGGVAAGLKRWHCVAREAVREAEQRHRVPALRRGCCRDHQRRLLQSDHHHSYHHACTSPQR